MEDFWSSRSSMDHKSTLTRVDLSESTSTITKLPSHALSHCTVLVNVTLPPNLTEIGEECFVHCTACTGPLILPPTVTRLGARALAHCTRLSGVSFATATTVPPPEMEVGPGLFQGCTRLVHVRGWPSCCRTGGIPASTFAQCRALLTIDLSSSSQKSTTTTTTNTNNNHNTAPSSSSSFVIGPSAFAGCASLLSLVLPDHGPTAANTTSVTLHSQALQGCHSLSLLTLSTNNTVVTLEGHHVLDQCTALHFLYQRFVHQTTTTTTTTTIRPERWPPSDQQLVDSVVQQQSHWTCPWNPNGSSSKRDNKNDKDDNNNQWPIDPVTGRNPLHFRALQGASPQTHACGGWSTTRSKDDWTTHPDVWGRTPLHYACINPALWWSSRMEVGTDDTTTRMEWIQRLAGADDESPTTTRDGGGRKTTAMSMQDAHGQLPLDLVLEQYVHQQPPPSSSSTATITAAASSRDPRSSSSSLSYWWDLLQWLYHYHPVVPHDNNHDDDDKDQQQPPSRPTTTTRPPRGLYNQRILSNPNETRDHRKSCPNETTHDLARRTTTTRTKVVSKPVQGAARTTTTRTEPARNRRPPTLVRLAAAVPRRQQQEQNERPHPSNNNDNKCWVNWPMDIWTRFWSPWPSRTKP